MYAGTLYLPCHGEVAIISLNVCDEGTSAIFGGADMPLLCNSPCKPAAPGFFCVSVMKDPAFNPLLVVFEKDRPPQS
jgi:hypothetical protein